MLPGDRVVPLLRTSGKGLAELASAGRIGSTLATQMLHTMSRRASESETRSWDASLGALSADLGQAGLEGVEVIVEYQLPISSKRVDVILAGEHPSRGGPSYVVVELKQWTKATLFENEPELVLQPTYGSRPVLHPVAQVRGYCEYLLDFVNALHGSTEVLAGAAYLHNATDDGVAALDGYPQNELGRLFTGRSRGDFHAFLQSRLSPTNASIHADRLLRSSAAPSKQLLAVAAEELRTREQFVLLDEQRVAFDLVLHEVEKARRGDHESVVVISGGPGTGKSVIALSLLGELGRRGVRAVHATGSRSFTQTLRRVAGHRAPRTKALFMYFNQFMTAERNGLDVLIADEAHRIRENSVDRYTPGALRRDPRRQVDELIDAARVPVFLLDQHQVVRPGEMGTVEDIEKHARERGLDVHLVDLATQYRSGGSGEYVAWVERLLGLAPGGPVRWTASERFSVATAPSPSAMETALAEKLAAHQNARIAAGYCWPWSDPRDDGSLVPDVRIGGWSRPWNLKGDRSVGDAPPAALWASDDRGFEQVGCVYTAQGFEYEWNGVLLGPDLVWRDGRWVTVRSANKDPDFRNTKKVSDADFDFLVRNVYKVLLTRGLRGVYIHSTDPETQRFLEDLVG